MFEGHLLLRISVSTTENTKIGSSAYKFILFSKKCFPLYAGVSLVWNLSGTSIMPLDKIACANRNFKVGKGIFGPVMANEGGIRLFLRRKKKVFVVFSHPQSPSIASMNTKLYT